jgi:hypothetical protein
MHLKSYGRKKQGKHMLAIRLYRIGLPETEFQCYMVTIATYQARPT